MSKIIKKVAPIALPVLGSLIPGVGPIVGAALGGGLGGLVSGGGLKGALKGAALGGLGGALSGGAGGLLGTSAGTFGPATAAQVASAGSTGGALANLAGGSGLKGLLSGGSFLGGGGATGGISNLTGLIKPAISLYSAGQEKDANDEALQQLLAAQGKATAGLQPYSQIGLDAQKQLAGNLSAGFDPSGIYDDPSYQFRVQQGQNALSKGLAASGMSQSGAAMKAAQEYGQNMATNEYQNAYDRWLAQNQQLAGVGGTGFNAASNIGGINMLGGMNQADATIGNQNIMSKTLADLLSKEQLGMYF